MNTKGLTTLCSDQDWFVEVAFDSASRYIVYASYIDSNVLSFVPSTFDDKQVLVHFAKNKSARKEDWTYQINDPYVPCCNKDTLINELEVLWNEYGEGVVADVFFEIHDGTNAITELSKEYPDAKNSVQKLYDMFGFDVMYSEIEGD